MVRWPNGKASDCKPDVRGSDSLSDLYAREVFVAACLAASEMERVQLPPRALMHEWPSGWAVAFQAISRVFDSPLVLRARFVQWKDDPLVWGRRQFDSVSGLCAS
jgi:hypothetical protein